MTMEDERTETRDPESETPRKSLWKFKEFVVGIVGAVSGVAGLASPSTETSRLLLIIVGAACIAYLVIRLWRYYFIRRNRDLREEIAVLKQLVVAQREGHQRYVDAIQWVIDREAVLFEEKLHVTVVVGETDDEDLVVEKRHTTPAPRVVHRSMRPIMPTDNGHPLSLEDISYVVRFPQGDHRADQLAMVEGGHLRVWLVFDTDLSAETDWDVVYHPKGLWAPLREKGRDRLRWRDQLPTAGSRPSALTEFVVRFMFPAGGQKPLVTERSRLGTVLDAERNDTGQWVVEWRDDSPDGRYYEWELSQTPSPGGA